jgi:hypothetical protein
VEGNSFLEVRMHVSALKTVIVSDA